ncbi:MAG: hypothetical protein HQK93_10675, partial [Nitrospirae bacterium]|nr:hypothetical protein [Nitrospirota bacterium]
EGHKELRDTYSKIFMDRVFENSKEEHKTYIDGLIEILKKIPQNERASASDIYDDLWKIGKNEKVQKKAEKERAKLIYAGILAVSFIIIALFSLMLIFLAIEKNTRQSNNGKLDSKLT